MTKTYKLVPISLEEYRILFDAGVWVYGSDHVSPFSNAYVLGELSDSRFPEWKKMVWKFCYTRIECDE
jgi:hypothetical protein